MKNTRLIPSALAITGLIALSNLWAGAATIAITNPSFESPDLASSGGNLEAPTGWTNSDPSAFIGYSGYLRASDEYATAPDGNQYLETNSSDPSDPNGFVESQTTSYDATIGDTFTLTVALGPGPTTQAQLVGTIALTIDGSVVAENTADSTGTPVGITGGNPNAPGFYPATFADATATYQLTAAEVLANPGLLDGAVGVELISPYGNGYTFDNVRLDVTTVPEPSPWAMMFAGLAFLVGAQRFTRKA